MDGSPVRPKSKSTPGIDEMAAAKDQPLRTPPPESRSRNQLEPSVSNEDIVGDCLTSGSGLPSGATAPTTPAAHSTPMFDDFAKDGYTPLDRLTMFDVLENLALPQRLESLQNTFQENAERLRRRRAELASKAAKQKDNIVGEWKKRVPQSEEQLDQYRRRIRNSVDRLNRRWNDSKNVTVKEKISFVTAIMNILISGYLIGGRPEYFHYWYTAQLMYFMPIRWYNYHKIGFHYFLADLCYYVNFLLILSIWFFPQSKRLFISVYCLAFGNNAVAIVMWRNSLVLHSFDKVNSLFIHIMPCATLHVLVHVISPDLQRTRFPAVHTIKFSPPSAPEHYSLKDMIIWATLPYAIWQLSYHLLITIRKRSKIAQGMPTSFTWLRRSYKNRMLGKFVLSFPENMQEGVFMVIQYVYAMLTMLPCPIWFWYRHASGFFLVLVFGWASYNGATYYIDVFGRRLEKELDQLKQDVARMSAKPSDFDAEGSPAGSPSGPQGTADSANAKSTALDLGPAAVQARSHSGGQTELSRDSGPV